MKQENLTLEEENAYLRVLLEKSRKQLEKSLLEVAKLYPARSPRAEKYQLYLATPEWRRKRDEVFDRENGLCQGCKQEPIEHVHHVTYSHIYDELLFQLIGVCENCHRKSHFMDHSFNPWTHES